MLPKTKKLLLEGIKSGRFFPELDWEMKALHIAEPCVAKGTPNPRSCGADAQAILTERARLDNAALKAHSINVCA